MDWIGDGIGIALVIAFSIFFVDGLVDGPWFSEKKERKPNDPIKPKWR